MEEKKGLNILVFTNDTASPKWRFDGIADRFHKNTDNQMFITTWKTWNGDTCGADIVILEMLTAPEMVHECHNQGAKVIFEADDVYIDAYGRERKNLQHIAGNWKQLAIDTIKACDAVTVTNKYLAENFRKITDKPVYILPNYIDFNWYGTEDLVIRRATNEVRVGWFGSKGHYEDLRMVVDAMKEVCEKYPQVKFVYMGYGGMSSDKGSTEIGWGEDVFSEIPREKREFFRGVEPDYWPIKHRLMDLDIGIAPLIDDYFNHCKTPIKWIEFAATKVPCVASPTVYGEHPVDSSSIVDHGNTGFIANTKEEWVEYISRLVEDKKFRLEMGEKAYNEVLKRWNIDNYWKEWDRVYKEVFNS